MEVPSIAVTGAAGLVGGRLLPLLLDDPSSSGSSRSTCASPSCVGVEARVPPGRHRRHRPASRARRRRRRRAPRRCRRPDPRRGADGAGQRRRHPPGARRGGRGGGCARSCGCRARPCTGRGRPTRCHSPRRAPLRPQPAVLARGPGRRGGADARGVAAGRIPTSWSPRCAPRRSSARVPSGCPGRVLLGRPPLRVRGAALPVQVVHVDDLASALALVATHDLPGVFNVAADGWLDRRRRPRGCCPRSMVPAVSRRTRSSARCAGRGRSASATCRRGSCPTSCTRG